MHDRYYWASLSADASINYWCGRYLLQQIQEAPGYSVRTWRVRSDTSDEEPDTPPLRELAYFHEPYWAGGQGDSLKTLLLFFEGIALTVPDYMRDTPLFSDPSLAQPLDDQGLLVRLSPESLMDGAAAESLAELMVEMLVAGAFDDLDKDVAFREISSSRLGATADRGLTEFIVRELAERGLAGSSEDGLSVPLHPAVRGFVLVALPHVLREPAERAGYSLQPVTNQIRRVQALLEFVDLAPLPTQGRVVAADLEQVTLDLTSIPLEDVLAFKETHGEAYRAYARDLRKFIRDLSQLSSRDRDAAMFDRREELADVADALRRHARKAWRKPLASFGLGIAGSAVSLTAGDPATASSKAAAAILGLSRGADPGSVYSYLFQARSQLKTGI